MKKETLEGEGLFEGLRGYAVTISAATGITDPDRLRTVEDVMRDDIFRSILDWQTAEQLQEAAREAAAFLAKEEWQPEADRVVAARMAEFERGRAEKG